MRAVAALALSVALLAAPLAAQTTGRPGVEVGADGLVLRTARDVLVVRMNARVQYDSRLFLDEATADATDPIQLRRAGPSVRATFLRDYEVRLNLDLSSGRPEPVEVSATARLGPALELRAGKVRVPVGLGRLQGGSNGPFTTGALAGALAPSRGLGVEARGTLAELLDYSLAAFDGVPDGSSGDLEWSGVEELIARGFLRPFATRPDHPLRGLGVGLSGSVGRHEGTPEAPALSSYRTGGGQVFFRHHGGDTPVVADGVRLRYSPQAYLYAGSVGLLTEYIVSSGEVRRGEDAARLTSRAWQLAGSWVLTGEPAAYGGVVPAASLDRRAGTWGAVELALRLDGLAADEDAFPLYSDPAVSARSARSYAAGLNWYLNRAVRLVVDYQVTRFAAAPSVGPRPDERFLHSRFQLSF